MNKKTEIETPEIDISFITLCYNQEDMITEHLDSLLYQVKNNLNSYCVQLVISDDASTDNTVETINHWLSINSHYFQSVELLVTDTNQGTCKNFVKAIRQAKGKFIKALAGDDIYLKPDMSEVFNKLIQKDVILKKTVCIRKL